MKNKSRLPSRILIAALSGWRFARPSRRARPDAPKRILIANYLLLGDTLLLTPLLAKLRLRYPTAQIVLTVPPAIAPLYQSQPYGVQAVIYDPSDINTLLALRSGMGFDLAIVPADNRYSWLALALGAKWIVAFAGDRPAYKNWPVDEAVAIPEVPIAWGDMVAGLIQGDEPMPYTPQQWHGPHGVSVATPKAPYCVLHVGARNPLRYWPSARWARLAESLAKRGLTPVWSAGRGEERCVLEADPSGVYTSFAGRLDLAQFWWLLKGARLLVCPDTGVAHLGRVVGVPTVTLFGPGSALLFGAGRFWRNAPYRAVTIANFPCRDQQWLFKRHVSWMRHCARPPADCNNGNRCMRDLSVDMVISAVDELLAMAPASRASQTQT